MTWTNRVRQSHRWISIACTLTVLANFVAMGMGYRQPIPWVTYAPLPFLALLLFSGLWLFAAPYVAKTRVVREER